MTSQNPSPFHRRFITVTCALATTAALAVGCAAPDEGASESSAPRAVIGSDLEVLEKESLEEALGNIVTDVEADYGGTVSLAIEGDRSAHVAGSDGSEPAWSTIKVPIAIAALRDGASEELVDAAIKESDNDAAYALWQQVNWTEGSAQDSIENLLKDFESDVEMNEAFGMSVWKVKDQARFASRIGCVPESDYVYDAMEEIVDWQQWGFAGIDGYHSKGGWGLDEETGQYTSRQLGVMPTKDGAVGVAVSMSWDTWGVDSDAATDVGFDSIEDLSAMALDDIAQRMDALIDEALETGKLVPVDDCLSSRTSTSATSSANAQHGAEESTRQSAEPTVEQEKK